MSYWLESFARAIKRSYLIVRTEGIRVFIQKAAQRINLRMHGNDRKDIHRSLSSINRSVDPSNMNRNKLRRGLKKPVVSIVIPVYNGIDYVPKCIESVFNTPTASRYEVIVIDQNSEDGTREYLQGVRDKNENFILIENSENVGFTRAVNQGSLIARGDFIVISNSDVIFTAGWLDRLIYAMHAEPHLGVISPVTNYVGEGPQLDPDAIEVTPETAGEYGRDCAKKTGYIHTDRLVFFCVLIRRNLFEFLGGLSEVYGLGNYEDDDFCIRAQLAGFKLAIDPGSFVFHYGSRTFKEQKISHVDWMLKNEKVFYQRVSDLSTQSPLIQSRGISQDPEVSVIVRTKDRPFFINNCLSSLANQTYRDFEVVVVNDGGVRIDGLLSKFEPYLSIQSHFNELPKGRGSALNTGVSSARGNLIAYLDDDDIYYPTHLQNLIQVLLNDHSNHHLAYTQSNKALFWFDEHRYHLSLIQRERFWDRPHDLSRIRIDNWIPLNTVMHRVESFKELGGFREDLEIFEDWEFFIRLSSLGDFHYVPRLTSEYRFRFSGQEDDSTLGWREKALSTITKLYREYPVEDQEAKRGREATVEKIRQQIATVRRIKSLDKSSLEKNFEIAVLLGDFSLKGLREYSNLENPEPHTLL